jgi:hypothetical protein
MGMSTSVKLLRDKNDKSYQEKLSVFNACRQADVNLPLEIDEYFGGNGVDNDPEYPLEIDFEPTREYETDWSQGFEIDIDDLPEGVRTIRFYNSW